MKLIKLTDKKVFLDKKVICIEKSAAYLNELCSRYEDIANRITMILDDNPRNQKNLQLGGREVPVYDLLYLEQCDLLETVILITSDYYKEYFDKIAALLKECNRIEIIYFFANKETEYELAYRDKYAESPLKNIIVFRSGPHANSYVRGMDFSDNARALFEYALSVGLHERYELVWIVETPDEFQRYKKYKNVFFLPFKGSVSEDKSIRDSYYRVLCLAKYFFFTDAYGFVRNCRSDQIRVQLWHGCGYKKRLSTVSCGKRYDYMTVTSQLYANVHAKEFGLEKSQMLITGCAKTDWLFQPVSSGMRIHLGIPPAKKYIFWLPTYRFSEQIIDKPVDGTLYQDTGLPLIANMQEMWTVNECLKKNNIMMIIKLHPFQDRNVVHIENYSNIVVLENDILLKNDIQINQILGMADALISDYSSTAVDYLVLDKPMAFCVKDVDSYLNTRGFVFSNIIEWLPGKLVFSFDDFLKFIEEIGSGVDVVEEKRTVLREKMHIYHDGNNSRRILKSLGII